MIKRTKAVRCPYYDSGFHREVLKALASGSRGKFSMNPFWAFCPSLEMLFRVLINGSQGILEYLVGGQSGSYEDPDQLQFWFWIDLQPSSFRLYSHTEFASFLVSYKGRLSSFPLIFLHKIFIFFKCIQVSETWNPEFLYPPSEVLTIIYSLMSFFSSHN